MAEMPPRDTRGVSDRNVFVEIMGDIWYLRDIKKGNAL